jgi:hypothetical protein
MAALLKDHMPAPPDNDVVEEKPRPHKHITSWYGHGPAGDEIGVEKEMDGSMSRGAWGNLTPTPPQNLFGSPLLIDFPLTNLKKFGWVP